MNAYELQQIKFMGFPSGSIMPVNNTTKKIQNYQFKLNEVLGKGNFSKVYRGVNELTNEPVAIKVVELSSIKTPALVDLLYSQIEILKTLNHPNIMRCYQVFTSANNCYIITEICSDGDLETRIRSRGPIPEREAYKTIYEMFQGLKYLADQNIVHRDFKIANILFNKGVAKIADFGFAKRTRDRFKDINIGSPIYMSPEGLIDNIYGPKTDVWAFGVFIYEILHGDTPLSFCQTEADLRAHIMTPLRLESFHHSISMDLRQLVLRCLDIHQQRRISIQQIQQTPFMRRISMEMGLSLPYELSNNHTKSGGKLPCSAGLQSPFAHHNSNSLFPPRSAGMMHFNNLLSPDNKHTSSPRVGLNSIGDDERRKNLSFQNVNLNNASTSKRGVSIERTNYFNNLQSQQTNASSSQDARGNRMNSRHFMKADNSGFIQHGFRIVGKSTILSFHQCVNLLHYCRLAYKVASQIAKIERLVGSQTKEYFVNWLFSTFQQVESKIPGQIRFQGQKASLRQKKLQQVINQYHKKYFKQLTISTPFETTLQGIQQSIANILKTLDDAMNDTQGDKRQLIITAHFLLFMYQTNTILERSLQISDYNGFMKKCNIEQFLTLKKQNYDENSYRQLRAKMDRLISS